MSDSRTKGKFAPEITDVWLQGMKQENPAFQHVFD